MDSVLTTGLSSNPNGTFVTPPSTAHNGAQGTYGAMLPTGNSPMASNLPSVNMSMWQGATPGYNNVVPGNNPMTNSQNPFVNATGKNLNPFSAYQYKGEMSQSNRVGRGAGDNAYTRGQAQRGNNPTSSPTSTGSFSEAAAMAGVLSRLEMGDLSVISQIPKADLDAMGLTELAQAAGAGGTTPPTDFQQTEAARYNAANNVPFTQQKRWDEKKKRYITVGEWMRQERSKYNKKGKYVGNRNDRPQEAAAEPAPTPEAAQFTVQQSGSTNFNTATG